MFIEYVLNNFDWIFLYGIVSVMLYFLMKIGSKNND